MKTTFEEWAESTKEARTCGCGYVFPIVRIQQVVVSGKDSISIFGELLCPTCHAPRTIFRVSNFSPDSQPRFVAAPEAEVLPRDPYSVRKNFRSGWRSGW